MSVDAVRERIVLAARLAAAWRPTGSRLRALGRATLTSFLAVGGMLWLLPSLRASGPVSVLVLIAIVAGVGVVVRPILVAVAALFGAVGLLIAGFLTQAFILDLAITAAPNVHGASFRDVVVASWLVALISAVVNWVFDVGSDDAFLARVLRHAARTARLDPKAGEGPGVLIVQIDGLGEDVLRQAITAGAVPTISRWLRTGTHTLRAWDTGAPATTPAGQAVLLHGDVTTVPGFRWYEKDAARLMVANRSRDAAEIERRCSDGRGLLADGGVSVSNLLSGDAPTRLLTMSDPRLSMEARRGVGAYLTSRGGLPRTIVLMLGEMITELQQGRRQRRRDVRPRVSRHSVFVLLRAVTTVLLRNLSVSLVADHLASGSPVLYVDFVDYDEVAHHAGPSRPESMRTLDGIDRVLQVLEAIAKRMNRDYELVVLSDHGQAQGATFRQQTGESLDEVVARLSGVGPTDSPGNNADEEPAERWGPLNVLLTTAARPSDAQAARAGRRGPVRRLLAKRTVEHADGASITLGPSRYDRSYTTERPVVAAGGSLAHVYLPGVDGRAELAQIESAHPLLVEGLRTHPQIGVVLVRAGAESGSESGSGELRALGADGWRVVTASGCRGGAGHDPVAPYGPRAAQALAQLDQREHVGDLVILGRFEAQLGEVTAFEELVGSHGGLGGGQDRAVLVVPAGWAMPEAGSLDGLAVHRLLVERLETLGLRAGTQDAPPEPDESAAEPTERAEPAVDPIGAAP